MIQIIVPVGTTVDVQHVPVVINSPPPNGALAQAAASLNPGQWGDVTSQNINESLKDPGSPNSNLRMHYSNSAPWNGSGIDFIGMDHGGSPALCRYHDSTNAWDNFIPSIGSHGYQFTVANPQNGDLYRIMCGAYTPTYPWSANSGIYKWNGTSFDFFAAGPEDMTNLIAHTPGVWWDGAVAGTQGLLAIYDSNYSRISLLNTTTKVYTHIDVATNQGGYYHTVSAYSKVHNCLSFGGGQPYSNDPQFVNDNRKLWKLNADLTVETLPDAPHSVGIFGGMNMNSGPDGNIYFLGFGEHWQLNPATKVWTKLSTPPIGQLYPNDHDAVFSSNTPYGIVYIGGRNINGVLDIKMRLYKC